MILDWRRDISRVAIHKPGAFFRKVLTMKSFLFAVPVAALMAAAADARTAELLNFTVTPPPITDGQTRDGSDLSPSPSVDEALASYAAAKAFSPAIDERELPSFTAGLRIPPWMKGRGTASRFIAGVSAAATAFPAVAEGCTWEPYKPNPRLTAVTEQRRARYYGLVAAAACEAGVPTHLLDALVTQESRYNPAARSPVGAIGLAQLMPGTARELGVSNPWDLVANLRGGARYLRAQLDEFKRYDLALGAYNAGPARVRRHGRVPAIRETLGYVSTILQDVRWSVGQGPRVAGADRLPRTGVVRTAMLAQF